LEEIEEERTKWREKAEQKVGEIKKKGGGFRQNREGKIRIEREQNGFIQSIATYSLFNSLFIGCLHPCSYYQTNKLTTYN